MYLKLKKMSEIRRRLSTVHELGETLLSAQLGFFKNRGGVLNVDIYQTWVQIKKLFQII